VVRRDEIRDGEVAVEAPPAADAGLVFVGRIAAPWADRLACPRQGRLDGPLCRIGVFAPWAPGALDGGEQYERLEVLYCLHLSRRDLVRQSPADDGAARGTISLRSPVRPNRPPSRRPGAALRGAGGAPDQGAVRPTARPPTCWPGAAWASPSRPS